MTTLIVCPHLVRGRRMADGAEWYGPRQQKDGGKGGIKGSKPWNSWLPRRKNWRRRASKGRSLHERYTGKRLFSVGRRGQPASQLKVLHLTADWGGVRGVVTNSPSRRLQGCPAVSGLLSSKVLTRIRSQVVHRHELSWIQEKVRTHTHALTYTRTQLIIKRSDCECPMYIYISMWYLDKSFYKQLELISHKTPQQNSFEPSAIRLTNNHTSEGTHTHTQSN